jgi:hypothetical protein
VKAQFSSLRGDWGRSSGVAGVQERSGSQGVQKLRSRNIANKSADCLSHPATPELLQLLIWNS